MSENIGQTLFELISNNDIEGYKKIIDENPSLLNSQLNIEHENLNIYFHDAASLVVEFNNKELFQYILDNHIDQLQVIEGDDIFNSQLISEMLVQKKYDLVNTFLEHPKVTPELLDWNNSAHNSNPLILAIDNGFDYPTINKFFKLGIDPIQCNSLGENSFTACSKNGDINVYDIINANNAIDDKNLDIDLVINRAIQYNNAPVFDELIQKSNKSLDELFTLAVQFKTTQILQTIILEDSFLPGSQQLHELTEIITYVYDNEHDHNSVIFLMDFLCNVKVKFEKFVNDENQNIWNLAINNKNMPLVEKLSVIPEIINQRDADGRTPLMYALDRKMNKMAEHILAQKPNVNIKDKQGNTALIYAAQHGMSYLIDPLIELNAFTYEKNKNGETALYWATKHQNFPMVAKLLWAGAPIATNSLTIKNKILTGEVDLAGNVHMNNRDLDDMLLNNFKTLVQIGFNLDALSEQGLTFPMHFVVNNHIANFASILECYFDPNQQKEVDGNTILMECASKTNPMFCTLFIKRFGTEIDAQVENDIGETAVDIAIKHNNIQGLWLILNQAGNVDAEVVEKAMPHLLSSQLFSMEELLNLCDQVDVQLQNIKTINHEDMWFSAIRRENLDDIKFLIVNFEEGPNFQEKNSENLTIEGLIEKSKDKDFKQDVLRILSPRKKLKP